MDLRPDEITGIIKSRIKDYGSKIRLEDTGTVAVSYTHLTLPTNREV